MELVRVYDDDVDEDSVFMVGAEAVFGVADENDERVIAVDDGLLKAYEASLLQATTLSEQIQERRDLQEARNEAFFISESLNYGDPIYELTDTSTGMRKMLLLADSKKTAWERLPNKEYERKGYKFEQLEPALTSLELIEIYEAVKSSLRKTVIARSWLLCFETKQFLKNNNVSFMKLNLNPKDLLDKGQMQLIDRLMKQHKRTLMAVAKQGVV